jgi:hypothetical protein
VTYGLNLEASANWEAIDDDEWTVPMHLTVTKLTKFGPFPMSIGGGIGIFTAAPGETRLAREVRCHAVIAAPVSGIWSNDNDFEAGCVTALQARL